MDAWLERHRLETTAFEDPLDACSHLLTAFATPPELAFVGAEGFSEGDAPLLAYLRDTWPHLAVVVYSGGALLPLGHDANLAVCCSETTLRDLLTNGPVELAARVRRVPIERLAAPDDDPVADAEHELAAVESVAAGARASAAGIRGGLRDVDAAKCAPLLTAEELAALLDVAED